jgi:hypothetical protein
VLLLLLTLLLLFPQAAAGGFEDLGSLPVSHLGDDDKVTCNR